MRILPSTIQTIKERANVLEVVEDFLSLKKKGTNYWSPCPFHNEKSASFSVTPSKGIYKCFGCGKGGDSLTFVMEIENLTYPEALKYLAKKYNIPIEYDETQTEEQKDEQNERESLLIALEYASKYFQDLLHNTEAGKLIGMSYFKERGFIGDTVKNFQLGYATEGWDVFTQRAIKEGYSFDVLQKAGLSILTENGKQLDRFRDRVIFPIQNLTGKAIAFGARLLKKDEKQPKYLNSPETLVYHKGNVLYGLFQAKKSIKEQDNCYLAEGYVDVISLHQAGISNVVASSGTALTQEQIRLIARFTHNITVLYDGDAAGIKAALRGLDLILEEGLNVKIVLFPDGEDPDSFLRKVGTIAFQDFITEKAQNFIFFKTGFYLKEAKNDPIKRTEMIKEITESLSKIDDRGQREFYIKQCSELLNIDEHILILETDKFIIKRGAQKRQNNASEPNPEIGIDLPDLDKAETEIIVDSPILFQEKENIRFLLTYAHIELEKDLTMHRYFLEEIADITFETPIYAEILHIFKRELGKGVLLTIDYFINQEESNEIKEAVIELITQKHEISHNWEIRHQIVIPKEEDLLNGLVYKAILRLKIRHIRKKIKQNTNAMQKAEEANDMDLQEELMIQGMEFKAIEMEIAKILGNVVLK